MQNKLIGRKEEQAILLRALASKEAEMVAVVGRRRVGKTFLITETYQDEIIFGISGLQHAPPRQQIKYFKLCIEQQLGIEQKKDSPSDWLGAFMLLANCLDKQSLKKKKVVFIDELPWIASSRPKPFLTGLSWFWNSWAERKNIVIVICGSAASWMIKNVVNHRGGLHNRITKRIFLAPFNLLETKSFLKEQNINYNDQQVLELYMAMGGIPHYLKEVQTGKSAIQNINDICFRRSGLLRDEFSRLYPALFAKAEKYITLIRTLAKKHTGLTRAKIVKISGLQENGRLSKILKELEQSSFISSYYPFGKRKKEKLFRLTDEYSLFYLRFIEPQKKDNTDDVWQHLSQTQAYKTWSGYAFENICLKHIPQIKKALSIAGVYSSASSFYKKGTKTEKGAQIDLVLDRNDKVINLFEIKYHNKEFVMTAAYAKALRKKGWIFQEQTKTRKYLMWVIITTHGLKINQHSLGLIEKTLTIEDLFG